MKEVELCDSEFWNANSTWFTESPKLSECFQNTALIWSPAALILLATICEGLNIRRARFEGLKTIPWSTFNVLRMLITLTLLLLKLDETIDTLANKIHEQRVVVSTLTAPLIQMVGFALLLLLYYLQRRAGLHTSATVWFYLLLSSVCSGLHFYSDIAELDNERKTKNLFNLIVMFSDFPVVVLLFILECRGDTPNLSQSNEHLLEASTQPVSPELSASFCSSAFFWWCNKIIWSGYKRKLEFSTLWQPLKRDRAGSLVPAFEKAWLSTSKNKRPKFGKRYNYQLSDGSWQQNNGIASVLLKLFGTRLLFSAFIKVIHDSVQLFTPMILKLLLAFMSNPNEPQWHGIVYAVALFVIANTQAALLQKYHQLVFTIGFNAKTALVGALYRKSLLLSRNADLKSTSGEIVNLMAVDSDRIRSVLGYINLLWSAPFTIIFCIVLLYRELGYSIFAGVASIALMMPINTFLSRRIEHCETSLMATKDERIKEMNGVLSGIKVIKLYAWEKSFMSSLFTFRNKELKDVRSICNLEAFQDFFWQCSPLLVAVTTFAVYIWSDAENVLTAGKAFVSLALFNLLRYPLATLPGFVQELIAARVAAKRLNKFFNSDETVKYVTRNEDFDAITVEGGTLAWSINTTKDEEEQASCEPILRDINLSVKPKSLVVVVGRVASGKSSLLASLLGEMHCISGRFNLAGSMSIAFVPQQAWIQNMSLRENILFGSAYDEQRYKRVLAACSLEADLLQLPGGDQAEIGEKGINLSGGQKQRVSLARACYSNSQIYLLDDPLSALDSHVAKHVYDKVLSSQTGLLREKTRLLVTNSLFVLPHADQIIALEEGRIIESGSYQELMSKENGYVAESMQQYFGSNSQAQGNADAALEVDAVELLTESKQVSKTQNLEPNEDGRLIEKEHLETGTVHRDVYLNYFRSISWFWFAIIFGSYVVGAAFDTSTSIWLALWSSDANDAEKSKDTNLRNLRISIYALLGALEGLLILGGNLALSQGVVLASSRLHTKLLNRVMHAPSTFFETTPAGRILNRFSNDINVVDTRIPVTLSSWFSCFLEILSTLVVICYAFPAFILLIFALSFVYYFIQRLFVATTRQLKRLESISKSPIYSHFNETLAGSSTIRAYGCENRFVKDSDGLIDRNQSCFYPNIVSCRWFSQRLEFFGNIIAAGAALYSVYNRSLITAGLAGLTISYSMSVAQFLNWIVRTSTEMETDIVSVERILEYTEIHQEDDWIKEHQRPPPSWPQAGAIKIEDYSTRYREQTDLVLRGVSLDINAREKIGVVGRTGSGKSSLSLALFRVLEPEQGRIMIDGLNLADCGLHDLRTKLTIIPQDPVLFAGTLRFNLDPLGASTDEEIWRALELAHLKTQLSGFANKLEHQVDERGENFSVGQRQLMCLARAILRKSKILVLDEATASVDLETDSIVQRTIREIFSHCTIITIAHRLHTILDSDRVLVMERGCVIELDTPQRLMSNPESAFYSLARDAGVEALQCFNQTQAEAACEKHDDKPLIKW